MELPMPSRVSSTCGLTRGTPAAGRAGSKSISGGGSRWFGTRRSRVVNGSHTAISKIGGPCGSPGSDCLHLRKFPRRVAEALGGGADLRVVLSEPAIQSRLRAAVHYQRGAYLRGNGSPHAPEVGQNLSFQTVFSVRSIRRDQRQSDHYRRLSPHRNRTGRPPSSPTRPSSRCRI